MADNRLYNQTQKFTLSASISLSDTTVALTSFNFPDGTAIVSGDLGSINYATIEPGTSREESITFTGLSGTSLTGVTRGIRFDSPYTQDTSLRSAHSSGAVLVLSNTAAFYDNFVNKNNDETYVETLTFTAPNYPKMSSVTNAPVTDEELASKKYVDDTAGGAAVSKDREVIAGTAGETVAAGNIVYFDPTDKEWKLADASVAGTAENVLLGIAQGAGTNGASISGGVLLSGLDSNQTGMTAGTKQFLSDSAGGISESTGTKEVSLGFAQSGSTTKLIFAPRYDQQLTEDQQDALAGTSGTASSTNKYVTNADEAKNTVQDAFAADAAGSDTYVITLSPVITAYVTGMTINFSANTANTGAATINVNSLGAKAIKKRHDVDLATGDIESGQLVTLIYDGTNFQMQSQVGALAVNSVASVPVDQSSTSTENVDTVVSTDFLPKNITVFFNLQGKKSSGTAAYSRGVATFNGTSIVSTFWDFKDTVTTTFLITGGVCDNVAPFAGAGGTDSKVEISIQSLSATGYTLRIAFTAGSTFTGADAKVYSIATG